VPSAEPQKALLFEGYGTWNVPTTLLHGTVLGLNDAIQPAAGMSAGVFTPPKSAITPAFVPRARCAFDRVVGRVPFCSDRLRISPSDVFRSHFLLIAVVD